MSGNSPGEERKVMGMDELFGDKPAPVEISPEMRNAARSFREMYSALVDQGFTSKQALELLGVAVSSIFTHAAQRNDAEDET